MSHSARKPLSRTEGYARSRGKEHAGIEAARTFLQTHAGVPTALIEGAEDNYRLGDLRTPSGRTVEVKRQPINPAKYRQNFVEVFEVTSNDRHRDGMHRLAGLLEVPVEAIEQLTYRDHRQTPPARVALGAQPAVSVSITSLLTAAYTVYVNPGPGEQHLYCYGRGELAGHLRTAMPGTLRRAAGMSNDDTFAVLVPLAVHRWSRPGDEQPWTYTGQGHEEQALARLSQVLGASQVHAAA